MPPPTGRSRSHDGEKPGLFRRREYQKADPNTLCSLPSILRATRVSPHPKGSPRMAPPLCLPSTERNPWEISCAHLPRPWRRPLTPRSFCARAFHTQEIAPPGKKHRRRSCKPYPSLRAAGSVKLSLEYAPWPWAHVLGGEALEQRCLGKTLGYTWLQSLPTLSPAPSPAE